MSKAIDLAGASFGKLTVLRRDPGRNRVYWECKCECGGLVYVRTDRLHSGETTTCGCYRKEVNKTHGMTNHPFYETFKNMKKRAKKRGHKVNFTDVAEAYLYCLSIGWKKGLAVCRGTLENPDQGDYEAGNIYIDTRGNNCRHYFNSIYSK